MTRRRRSSPWRLVLWTGVCVGVIALLRPWTVRPIESAKTGAFDPAAYVDGIWNQKVLPAAQSATVDVVSVPPGTSRSLFVKGSGIIDRVDLSSRIGLAYLRPTSANAEVALQIGPVIRGTALRDALEFIRFTDFINQLQFAAVANALNDRVLRSVIGELDAAALPGATISFAGAVTTDGRIGRRLDVVPVVLDVTRGSK